MTETIVTVLILAALVFALVDLIRSDGQSLTAWAVAFLSLALLTPRVF